MRRIFLLIALAFSSLWGNELPDREAGEIVVDLRNPIFIEGTLSTEEGGVIVGDDLRVQARKLTYIHETVDGVEESRIYAEGDLMLEYGDNVFIGERLEFDITNREGIVYCGRSALGPWYAGGTIIRLQCDGSYLIENGYLTTCESMESDWRLEARRVKIHKGGWVSADMVNVRFFRIPLFWIPNFQTNLNYLLDAPIRYRVQYDRRTGGRVSLRYRFFTWNALQAYLRLEYLINRGPAAGIETEYCPTTRCAQAMTQSYIARDNSIDNPRKRTRYRYAGTYHDDFGGSPYRVCVSYDALSDSEMPSDYRIDDFNLKTARRTEIQLHRQSQSWMANLLVIPRLNNFQTINQKLPSLQVSWRPIEVGNTGVVIDNRLSAGYVDYVFANETHSPGFNASRFELQQTAYRPIRLGCLTLLPTIGMSTIAYSDSPQQEAKVVTVARGGFRTDAQFSKIMGCYKHVIEPYTNYSFMTEPTVPIPSHFLFSDQDALTRLNYFRCGLRNYLYRKQCGGIIQPLKIDLFAYAFVRTPTIAGTVPRLYTDTRWQVTPWMTVRFNGAWNLSHNEVDYAFTRLETTLSENLAFQLEYRYRGPFDWLKADQWNFSLDSFRQEEQLLLSPLSDRRNTLLSRAFLRATPTLSFELETRWGWRRRRERAYFEAKATMEALLSCNWNLRAFYEHAEHDERFSVGLTLGATRRPCNPGRVTTVW